MQLIQDKELFASLLYDSDNPYCVGSLFLLERFSGKDASLFLLLEEMPAKESLDSD